MKIDESVGFLETCFKRIDPAKNREKIVTAVGIHGRSPGIFGFLKKVLTGDFADKIRESAAFWIGQQQTPEAAKVLLHTVANDKSSKVREHAVFGLYLVDCKEADDALVQIATKGKEKGTRKKAIFWLGQKAVKRTAELLGGIIDDDPDSDIQKAAVFALSQHPEGLNRLIKIATTHRSLKVRKQAISWLGQSNDPRALDTILAILKK
jgi:HEAT repeat protein